jgi:hypothetical protein
MATHAVLTEAGWTVADLGGANNSTIAVASNHALEIDCTDTADDGIEMQFNIARADDAAIGQHNIIPSFISTTTAMDGREMFFQVRMGTDCSSATVGDGKFLMGIFENKAVILTVAGGLPAVDAGGGFGFHKGEGGAVTALSTNAAITTAGQALVPAVSQLATTANQFNWHTYAARCRIIDASAGTGVTDFWYDGIHRGRIENTQPFDSTETYEFVFAAANAVSATDYQIDYILTGITRPGLTWPYTNGVIY